ncbi:uncharacterized protein LOC134095977 isoform X2 [Sardina pilchardus]|uniref:uncharacterized protein LOC134095977 isoform X2 n=1 Tax=Sardina pilchardus TaxID=27697 RepID=UPI002E165C53
MMTSISLLIVLVAAEGFPVQGPLGPVVAPLGGSVLLPCSVETPLPLEELEVEWRRPNSNTMVHLFKDKKSRPEAQNAAYEGRAHFFTGEFAKGNYSLWLTNTTVSDAGPYKCLVYSYDQQNETQMEIQEFGRQSSKMIFAVVTMVSGALAALLSCIFRRMLCKGKSAVLLHSCHIIIPNILLFIGITCAGTDQFETYTSPAFTGYDIQTGLIIKHTISMSTINLLRILLLFKVCPHLNIFPVGRTVRRTASIFCMPVVNLVFGIVSSIGLCTTVKHGCVYLLLNVLPVIAVGLQAFHLIEDLYSPPAVVTDTMFIFFLSFACISQHKSTQTVKNQVLIYEIGASVLPIFNGIFLSYVALEISMIHALNDPFLSNPHVIVIPVESLFLMLWICFQAFAKEQPSCITREERVLLQILRQHELHRLPDISDNESDTNEVVDDTAEGSER